MTVPVSLGDRAEDRLAADRRVMRRDRVLWVVAAAMVAWLGVDPVALRATERSPTGSVVVGVWVDLLPLVTAAVTVGLTTGRAHGVDRLFGVALSMFCWLWLAGNLVWAVGPPAGLSISSQRWWAEVFYAADYVPAMVAAVVVCGRPRLAGGLRGLVDVAVVALVACYLGWEIQITSTLAGGGSLSVVLSTASPVLDVLFVVLALSAAVGAGQHLAPSRLLVVAAFVGLAALDSLVLTRLDSGARGVRWLDDAYQVPELLIGLAAVVAYRHRALPARPQLLASRVPMVAVTVGCFAAAVVAASHLGRRPVDLLVVTAAVLVVVARALVSVAELRRTATGLERARSEQERLAVTDGLTGLYNRRFFEEFLRLEAGRSLRTGSPVSLIVADLDHFKRVNDALGHPVGDRVLVEAARRVRSAVRGSDVVARYGGEEFAVVLPETDPATALEIAERCRRALQEAAVTVVDDRAGDPRGSGPTPRGGPGITVSGSFGVATLWTVGGATVTDLVRAADRALYRAKATGRNRVAPAGEWDFLTPTGDILPGDAPPGDAPSGDTGPPAPDPVADALFRAAELLDADRGPDGFGAAVGDWAGVLADHLGLDAGTRARCVLGGRLRDLGKLAIPLSVLTRPGPLTNAERALVETHPEQSEALVALVPSVADLGRVVRAHHERVDGGGYPDHLTGAAIPLEARVIAVCDAWAAMRTPRPHAAARSPHDARREITLGRGTQFDPAVADLFLALQDTGAVGDPAGRVPPGRGTETGAARAPRAGPGPAPSRSPPADAGGSVPGGMVAGGVVSEAGVLTRGAVAGRVAAIAAQPHEHAVLERLVEAAQELVPARYAIVLLVGPDAIPTALAHRGMSARDVAALPHLPRPVGLVGAVLAGQTLHLARLSDHPDSVGFPTGHVPMGPLLGLPITVDGRVEGGLYLTRSPGEPPFTDDAAQVAAALTRQAGAGIAALRTAAAARAQGRGPESRTDGAADAEPAQASPVIRQIVASARTLLGVDLTFLARVDGDRQTFTAVDAGPGAPALVEGATVATADGYCGLMLAGRIPNAVPDTRADPLTAGRPVTAALGVGAYYGVPVHLSDGTPDGIPYGTLCGLNTAAMTAPTSTQRQAMVTIAGLIGQRLAEEQELARTQGAGRAAFLPLLAGDRSTIVVQPIVDLTTRTTVGYEALSRFTDVTGAPRRPDQVFAEAAQVGLGVRLELTAARAALDLLPDLPAGTYLSVNLSPQAVCDPRTYDLLHDLPLDRVVVELTEHDQISDYTTIVHALAALRARGLRLAIDDAGSGFAGLHHLAELSPDLIKLDVAFVRDIDTDPVRRAVARAVIGFAVDVGATLIAEGIETDAELDQLRRLGAPLGQGFLLARPALPAELLTARTLAGAARPGAT